MLLEILEKVYGRNKKGELSHHAIKFCKKHNLSLDGENPIEDIMVAFSMLSNKIKREIAIRLLMEFLEQNTSKKDVDILDLRKTTYKQACGKYHPDNKDTGSESIFKFIQEIKFSFWDYKGNPRKEISDLNWVAEKRFMDNPPF